MKNNSKKQLLFNKKLLEPEEFSNPKIKVNVWEQTGRKENLLCYSSPRKFAGIFNPVEHWWHFALVLSVLFIALVIGKRIMRF